MESIRYANLRKALYVTGLIMIAISIASADVSISNSYYTSGSESQENMVLHNMDYSNSASISCDSYSSSSKAITADPSEASTLKNSVYSNSLSGAQGFNLEARDSNDMEYAKTLAGGSTLYTSLSYNVKSNGETDALPSLQVNFFNPKSVFNENIYNLVNNDYEGKLQSYGSLVYISGKGVSNGGNSSSFNDTISYAFMGKDCRMDSFLREDESSTFNIPVEYWWETYLSQVVNGTTGMDMSAGEGNFAEFGIKGFSSILGEQTSPGVGWYWPATNEPVPITGNGNNDDSTEICSEYWGIDCDNSTEDVDEDIGYTETTNVFPPHMVYRIEG